MHCLTQIIHIITRKLLQEPISNIHSIYVSDTLILFWTNQKYCYYNTNHKFCYHILIAYQEPLTHHMITSTNHLAVVINPVLPRDRLLTISRWGKENNKNNLLENCNFHNSINFKFLYNFFFRLYVFFYLDVKHWIR